jgi:hypothetical protein
LYCSVIVSIALPSTPPSPNHQVTLIAFGFFGGLRFETPTGVPCAAAVEPGAAPPPAGAALAAGAALPVVVVVPGGRVGAVVAAPETAGAARRGRGARATAGAQ